MAKVINTTEKRKIHPLKFALWIGCASITMMFAAFTSAYLVRRAGGNWLEFELPQMFFISTGLIIASSVFLHLAFIQFKKKNKSLHLAFSGLAMVLGIGFVITQYLGWQELTAQNIGLRTNPSSSFIYVISGLHVVHVLGGIAALIISFLVSLTAKDVFKPFRKLRFELVLHYWHFVDILWIYLLVFFLTQQ